MPASLPVGLVVAGTRSGCGKTSVALGLMRALTRRGRTVQAFKVGPDFIDPSLHALATGRPSHNLDSWMCPPGGVRDIYARQAAGADVAVIEGVMGLFDGSSATDEIGSTAHVAKLLGLPVLLVADATALARSVAALVDGYRRFDPALTLAGVVLNKAASPSHATLLRQAMAAAWPDLPVFGVLPREDDVATPSRHLGLVTAADLANAGDHLDRLADWLDAACDVEALVATVGRRTPPQKPQPVPRDDTPPQPRVRLGVARDRAFCFYYEENFRQLQAAGAELVFFSPLRDEALPPGIAGLYLGGGYPELWGETLAANTGLRQAVRAFCRDDRPVLAECGGFMFLMDALIDGAGTTFPMAGVFPFRARLGARSAALGYREVTTRAATPLGPPGTVVRGHEFHYSHLVGETTSVPAVYALTGRQGPLDKREGFLRHRTLGSYVHLHFGSNPQAARAFVAACRRTSASPIQENPGGE